MYRFACAAVLVIALLPCAPARAQDSPSISPSTEHLALSTEHLALSTGHLAPSTDQALSTGHLAPSTEDRAPSTARAARPAALVPLYASFAALQAADFHSTSNALASGAGREANPVMSGIAGNRAAFAAVKAASTAGIIWAGEKLWKKNRAGAIVLMAVANGVMSAVVAHNYGVNLK